MKKKRSYFDSGNFALSAANRATDDSIIQTGTAHPARESISHPYAPVPSTSNINNVNKDIYGKTSPSPKMTSSFFVRRTEIGHTTPLDGEEGC
jgi:hypothetical protein